MRDRAWRRWQAGKLRAKAYKLIRQHEIAEQKAQELRDCIFPYWQWTWTHYNFKDPTYNWEQAGIKWSKDKHYWLNVWKRTRENQWDEFARPPAQRRWVRRLVTDPGSRHRWRYQRYYLMDDCRYSKHYLSGRYGDKDWHLEGMRKLAAKYRDSANDEIDDYLTNFCLWVPYLGRLLNVDARNAKLQYPLVYIDQADDY